MGWDWDFALMPYGPMWREHRRGFHQYFNSVATAAYSTVLEQQQLTFMDTLLRQPEDFLSLIRL